MSTHTTSTVRTRVAVGLVAVTFVGLTAACGVKGAGDAITPEPAAHHPRKVKIHRQPPLGPPPAVTNGTGPRQADAERRAAQHDARFHGAP